MKKEKCSGNCTHSTRIAWQSRRLSARDSRKENLDYGRRKTISRKRDKKREDGLRHPSVRHNCSVREKNEKKARTQTSRKPDFISLLLSHPSRFSVRLFSNFQSRISFFDCVVSHSPFLLGDSSRHRQTPTLTEWPIEMERNRKFAPFLFVPKQAKKIPRAIRASLFPFYPIFAYSFLTPKFSLDILESIPCVLSFLIHFHSVH